MKTKKRYFVYWLLGSSHYSGIASNFNNIEIFNEKGINELFSKTQTLSDIQYNIDVGRIYKFMSAEIKFKVEPNEFVHFFNPEINFDDVQVEDVPYHPYKEDDQVSRFSRIAKIAYSDDYDSLVNIWKHDSKSKKMPEFIDTNDLHGYIRTGSINNEKLDRLVWIDAVYDIDSKTAVFLIRSGNGR